MGLLTAPYTVLQFPQSPLPSQLLEQGGLGDKLGIPVQDNLRGPVHAEFRASSSSFPFGALGYIGQAMMIGNDGQRPGGRGTQQVVQRRDGGILASGPSRSSVHAQKCPRSVEYRRSLADRDMPRPEDHLRPEILALFHGRQQRS